MPVTCVCAVRAAPAYTTTVECECVALFGAQEAETLCSRIGIVTRGRMRCLGNQQHLKSRFGGGYRLFLNFAPHREAEALGFVCARFPYTVLDVTFRYAAASACACGELTPGARACSHPTTAAMRATCCPPPCPLANE